MIVWMLVFEQKFRIVPLRKYLVYFAYWPFDEKLILSILNNIDI
jgi:hypothetical protein